VADPITEDVTPSQRAALGLSLGACFALAPVAVSLACGAPPEAPAPVPTARSFGGEARAPAAPPLPKGVDPLPRKLWVQPESPVQEVAEALRPKHPDDAELLDRLANEPTAIWLGGWTKDPKKTVAGIVSAAAKEEAIPVLVPYNIPNRDCGQYSAGGEAGAKAYQKWIGDVAAGLGQHPAIVILEPDSLTVMDCLTDLGMDERLALLGDAVTALSADKQARIYLDGGHPNALPVDEMAARLQAAGVERTRGFALNVSNFVSTKDNVRYGEALAARLGAAQYVVDTSRNGRGASGDWCNPFGRALGEEPSTHTGLAHADAYLWVKRPGESDGACHGGPPAGKFWGAYALELAKASWEPELKAVADDDDKATPRRR